MILLKCTNTDLRPKPSGVGGVRVVRQIWDRMGPSATSACQRWVVVPRMKHESLRRENGSTAPPLHRPSGWGGGLKGREAQRTGVVEYPTVKQFPDRMVINRRITHGLYFTPFTVAW
jgi:hypothetical protein